MLQLAVNILRMMTAQNIKIGYDSYIYIAKTEDCYYCYSSIHHLEYALKHSSNSKLKELLCINAYTLEIIPVTFDDAKRLIAADDCNKNCLMYISPDNMIRLSDLEDYYDSINPLECKPASGNIRLKFRRNFDYDKLYNAGQANVIDFAKIKSETERKNKYMKEFESQEFHEVTDESESKASVMFPSSSLKSNDSGEDDLVKSLDNIMKGFDDVPAVFVNNSMNPHNMYNNTKMNPNAVQNMPISNQNMNQMNGYNNPNMNQNAFNNMPNQNMFNNNPNMNQMNGYNNPNMNQNAFNNVPNQNMLNNNPNINQNMCNNMQGNMPNMNQNMNQMNAYNNPNINQNMCNNMQGNMQNMNPYMPNGMQGNTNLYMQNVQGYTNPDMAYNNIPVNASINTNFNQPQTMHNRSVYANQSVMSKSAYISKSTSAVDAGNTSTDTYRLKRQKMLSKINSFEIDDEDESEKNKNKKGFFSKLFGDKD